MARLACNIIMSPLWKDNNENFHLTAEPLRRSDPRKHSITTFQTRGRRDLLEVHDDQTHIPPAELGLNPSGHTGQRSHTQMDIFYIYNDVLCNEILSQ